MGERSMKHNEVKKKKKSDVTSFAPSEILRAAVQQPELIKKAKKIK